MINMSGKILWLLLLSNVFVFLHAEILPEHLNLYLGKTLGETFIEFRNWKKNKMLEKTAEISTSYNYPLQFQNDFLPQTSIYLFTLIIVIFSKEPVKGKIITVVWNQIFFQVYTKKIKTNRHLRLYHITTTLIIGRIKQQFKSWKDFINLEWTGQNLGGLVPAGLKGGTEKQERGCFPVDLTSSVARCGRCQLWTDSQCEALCSLW